jgi:iron(III) transport system permease protein
MRGLVICWMLIGGLGFLIFPWYVTGDGFFSINWIKEYSLEITVQPYPKYL